MTMVAQISRVPSIRTSSQITGLVELEGWADEIRDGLHGMAALVRTIRQAAADGNRELYDHQKGRLPCVLPSLAAPPGSARAGLEAPHTGIYNYDIDRKGASPAGLAAAWQAALELPQTALIHHSAGGRGHSLYILGPATTDGHNHRWLYHRILAALPAAVRDSLDTANEDAVNRLRAGSHCPCLVYNPAATRISIDDLPDVPEPHISTSSPQAPADADTTALAAYALSILPNGDLPWDTWWHVLASAHAAGVDYETAAAWSAQSVKDQVRKTLQTWGGLSNVTQIGPRTLFYFTDMYCPGWRPARRDMAEYERVDLDRAFAQLQAVGFPVETDGNGEYRTPGLCQLKAERRGMTLTVTYAGVPDEKSFPKMICSHCEKAALTKGRAGKGGGCNSKTGRSQILRALRRFAQIEDSPK